MIDVKRLAVEEADILIEGAEQSSLRLAIPMCIAVTDESGHLLAFRRMDGGKITSISIAIDKAFTGAAARKPTHVYSRLCVSGQPTFGIHITNGGHFSIIGGGFPVIVDGAIVGGIGISSGTAKEDQEVGEAALQYFYQRTGYQP